MERKGISIFDNTDHGLAGIEDDLVPVVIVISGGTVIGSLLPIHMYSSAIGEELDRPGWCHDTEKPDTPRPVPRETYSVPEYF